LKRRFGIVDLREKMLVSGSEEEKKYIEYLVKKYLLDD